MVVVSSSAVDCQCGKEPVDPSAPTPVFAVAGLKELVDARVEPHGFLVAARRKDLGPEAISFDAKGSERWRSSPAEHILLGAAPGDPVFAVDLTDHAVQMSDASRRVTVFDATTGRIERTVIVARRKPAFDTWLRDADRLYVIEAPVGPGPATLAAIDTANGNVRWAKAPGLYIDGSVHPTTSIFTDASVYLFCKTLARGAEWGDDVCRFSLSDGMLVRTFPGPVIDFARSRKGKIFLLRSATLEALSDEGELLWTRTLPDMYNGTRIVAHEGWLAVLVDWVRRKDDYQEQLLALDANDGHELWMKDSGGHGEHYQSELAIAEDRLFLVSNVTPNIRVLDGRGNLVFAAPMKTQFYVTTEAIGGFVERLHGPPILAPPFLALARGEQGLTVYRTP